MTVVFDIETVRAYKNLGDAPDDFIHAWETAHERRYADKGDPYETFERFGGLHPEFGKIVCVSLIDSHTKEVKSFVCERGNDGSPVEWMMMNKLANYLDGECNSRTVFVGHNIKMFDVPYLQTRFLANGISTPKVLQTFGKKPWELLQFHDTLEIWRGGAFKTTQVGSLESCCITLGIETPKDGISGADVGRVYYDDDDLMLIVEYCEKDIMANGKLYKELKRLGMMG